MNCISSRTSLLVRQRLLVPPSAVRQASSSAEDHNADEAHHYPKEGFNNPFWRRLVLGSLIVAGAYKYAPEPSDDVYLTRWIALYGNPRELWEELAAKHTSMSLDLSETRQIVSDAQRNPVHRYRYPLSFENKSPFLTPVGMDSDTTKIVVKPGHA